MTNSEIGGHLGRHIEFIKRLRVDSCGLLECCRGSFSEHFLKFSACNEFVPAFTHIYPDTLGLYCEYEWHYGYLGDLFDCVLYNS